MYEQDIGLQIADGSADLQGMFVKVAGLRPKSVTLDPGHRTQGQHQRQNRAQADAHLRPDLQIPHVLPFLEHGSRRSHRAQAAELFDHGPLGLAENEVTARSEAR